MTQIHCTSNELKINKQNDNKFSISRSKLLITIYNYNFTGLEYNNTMGEVWPTLLQAYRQ